jgi:uncharacterized protein (TIGR02147 family)
MARQFEVLPSQLSQVLRGKASFSVKSARKIAHKLRLEPRETEYLLLLVQIESEANPEIRAQLIDRLNEYRRQEVPVRDLGVDLFKHMSDWYHPAILELVLIEGFELTAENAAKKLGISTLQAQVAIDRLERLELIERDPHGHWTRPEKEIKFVSPNPSAAFRAFYRQMFDKISSALSEQDHPKERLSGFETLPVAPESLPEINDELEKFYQNVHRIARKYPKRSEVYHLGVHFINLTCSREKESS